MTFAEGSAPGVSYVRAGEGPATWVVGDTYTFKATAASTGGAFALIEASIPPGNGPPPHLHTREDEAFYLLDGELEISVGQQTTLVRAGDFAYLPRNCVHWFRNPGVAPAKALILVTPGGFERFFTEIGVPARPGESVPPFDPADGEHLAEVNRRYGGQIFAPTGAATT
jgi:quercetin dioxygenase-like cupin family protein